MDIMPLKHLIKLYDQADPPASSSSRARRPARRPPSPPDSLDEPLPLSRDATPECIDADDPLALAMIAEGVYNGGGSEVDYIMDDVAPEVQPYEPSSPISINGRNQWKGDVQACGKLVGEDGWAIEGYVGLEASVSGKSNGDSCG